MMRPELRDRRVLLGGGLIVSALLFHAFYPFGPGDGAATVIVPAVERRPAAATASSSAESPIPSEAPVAAPRADGLRLYGLTATGAIVGFSGGGQRLVLLGRDVLPGLKLAAVRQHHALLASAAGTILLGFAGPEQAAGDGAGAAGAAVMPVRSLPERARREETLQHRFGLAPRRSEGRITGFAVRPGAGMPALQRAGLKAGDVIVGVNGQTFDSEEKVMELATEIAGSYTAEFEFERNGRRMRAALPVNPRP